VVAMINQKGGCGKTSTCFHLAGAFARLGRRVLLVDNDPQASLTQGFLGPAAASALDPRRTVAAAYRAGADPDPAAVVVATPVPGVDLVPGSIALNAHNLPREAGWGDGQWGLRSFLGEASAGYDLTLVDCPPNLCLCSWAAMLAASDVVVPLQAEDFGSQGLAPVQAALHLARGPNPALRLAGYLLTMFDRRLSVHLTYEAMLRDLYGPEVFGEPVPRAKDYVEAVAARTPVGYYRPKGAAARAVAAVAAEVDRRLAGPAAGVGV
jgi:chromosome partitioning protein